MKTRLSLLTIVGYLLFLCTGWAADDTGAVSIVGRHTDEAGALHTVGITLINSNRTWVKSEPGSATHFFDAKRGVYRNESTNVVILRNQDNTRPVGELAADDVGVDPAHARKGATGKGYSDEKAITFTWTVE